MILHAWLLHQRLVLKGSKAEISGDCSGVVDISREHKGTMFFGGRSCRNGNFTSLPKQMMVDTRPAARLLRDSPKLRRQPKHGSSTVGQMDVV